MALSLGGDHSVGLGSLAGSLDHCQAGTRVELQQLGGRLVHSLTLLLVESFRVLLAPAVLCHKEPARRIQYQH